MTIGTSGLDLPLRTTPCKAGGFPLQQFIDLFCYKHQDNVLTMHNFTGALFVYVGCKLEPMKIWVSNVGGIIRSYRINRLYLLGREFSVHWTLMT